MTEAHIHTHTPTPPRKPPSPAQHHTLSLSKETPFRKSVLQILIFGILSLLLSYQMRGAESNGCQDHRCRPTMNPCYYTTSSSTERSAQEITTTEMRTECRDRWGVSSGCSVPTGHQDHRKAARKRSPGPSNPLKALRLARGLARSQMTFIGSK